MTPSGGKRTPRPGKRLGRPASTNPRRNRVDVRLTDDEMAQLATVAPSPSEAVRELLQQAAGTMHSAKQERQGEEA